MGRLYSTQPGIGGNAQQLNWRYSSVARGHSASAVVSCELLTKGLYYGSEAYQ